MTGSPQETSGSIAKVRSDEEIAVVSRLVWEFFDVVRDRYPDMIEETNRYIAEQDVAGELRNFREIFLPPAGECFIARVAGEPVGMIMLKPHGEDTGEMNRMYVREQARGRGLGRALCTALIDEARRLGYRRIVLDALYRHREALPLYESVGFRRVFDPDAFGAGDERIIHMQLDLA
jgi:GNAT superfamily N-acetyltransferase